MPPHSPVATGVARAAGISFEDAPEKNLEISLARFRGGPYIFRPFRALVSFTALALAAPLCGATTNE